MKYYLICAGDCVIAITAGWYPADDRPLLNGNLVDWIDIEEVPEFIATGYNREFGTPIFGQGESIDLDWHLEYVFSAVTERAK